MLQINMLNQKCMFLILNCGFEDLRTELDIRQKRMMSCFAISVSNYVYAVSKQ